jgi:hypothetical protein
MQVAQTKEAYVLRRSTQCARTRPNGTNNRANWQAGASYARVEVLSDRDEHAVAIVFVGQRACLHAPREGTGHDPAGVRGQHGVERVRVSVRVYV